MYYREKKLMHGVTQLNDKFPEYGAKKVKKIYRFWIAFCFIFYFNDNQDSSFTSCLIFPHNSLPL